MHEPAKSSADDADTGATIPDSLTLAVMSDLHVYESAPKGMEPSWSSTSTPEDQASQHPISALKELIAEQELRADYLVCCGDLGDKASPGGIKYAWDRLQQLSELLEARQLVVTAGNHDMDSRQLNQYDAKGLLLGLSPEFPFHEPELTETFWARNFVIINEPQWRIVVVNSSAYHGYGAEHQHGRVSTRTISALKKRLSQRPPPPVNVLVCHHHPQKIDSIDEEDYSEMKGGTSLVKMLGDGTLGSWVMIHGHKHYPRISYASGTSSRPVIFSAGSLSVLLREAEVQNGARNQFYLLRFPISLYEELELTSAGLFKAWDWANSSGWNPAQVGSGLPASGGFGHHKEPPMAAKSLAGFFTNRGEPFIEWSEVLEEFPRLQFLLPEDLINTFRELKSKYKIRVFFDEDHVPQQLASDK